jgi:hypothetical protein
VAKIMPSLSRSARVNFGAFPTTRSALANENMHNFRDETASDPSQRLRVTCFYPHKTRWTRRRVIGF